MQIGPLDCKNRWSLAPMCDVTNLPFRRLCRELGAGLVMTEMLSAVDLAQAKARTLKLMEFEPDEAPVGVQISGVDNLEIMARAAARVEDHGASLLNLNCGCPVKKVIKGGSGSALLKAPDLLQRICRRLRTTLRIPLTLKIRAGWDGRHVNALEVGRMAQGEGVDAIMIHARTREQGYEGAADWALIAQLKAQLSIPVIGNGDIFHPRDAFRMLQQTGCDGVMIGRGAMGNPWIFRGLRRFEAGDITDAFKPTDRELDHTVRRHFDAYVQWLGEHRACLQFRKHLLWYTHGLPGQSALRAALKTLHRPTDFDRLWTDFLAALQRQRPSPETRVSEGRAPLATADQDRAAFKPKVGNTARAAL